VPAKTVVSSIGKKGVTSRLTPASWFRVVLYSDRNYLRFCGLRPDREIRFYPSDPIDKLSSQSTGKAACIRRLPDNYPIGGNLPGYSSPFLSLRPSELVGTNSYIMPPKAGSKNLLKGKCPDLSRKTICLARAVCALDSVKIYKKLTSDLYR
jgi:hypothetical protein